MDAAQILLIVVISILSLLLVVLGVQVFFILREIKNTLSRANKVLEDTSFITKNLSGSISSFTNLASGLKIGTVIATILKFAGKREEKNGRK